MITIKRWLSGQRNIVVGVLFTRWALVFVFNYVSLIQENHLFAISLSKNRGEKNEL